MAVFFEDHGQDFDFYPLLGTVQYVPPALHMHPHYEAELTLSYTRTVLNTNNAVTVLSQPFLALRAPYCMHTTEHDRNAETQTIAFFFGSLLTESLPAMFDCIAPYRTERSVIFPLSEDCLPFLKTLCGMFLERDRSPEDRKLLFGLMLGNAIRATDPKAVIRTTPAPNYLTEVIDYIGKHYCEPITAEDIAKSFFLSRSKLYEDFRAYTGTSIHQLISEMRINHATYLLINTDLSVQHGAFPQSIRFQSWIFPSIVSLIATSSPIMACISFIASIFLFTPLIKFLILSNMFHRLNNPGIVSYPVQRYIPGRPDCLCQSFRHPAFHPPASPHSIPPPIMLFSLSHIHPYKKTARLP